MDLQYDKRVTERMATFSASITPQDQRELEKFTKFFILKTAQVIVQSRQGVKMSTKSKPATCGVDWFNISVPDCNHVTEATKRAFVGEAVSSSLLPMCIEISLRTVDGDEMVLETWTLGLRHEPCEPSMKVMCTVYYRMGILLKSLISISRITPAYKLSRKQSADSYVIMYNVYTGDQNVESLGEKYKKIKVGQLCTPAGTIFLALSYRTKMTISATNNLKSNESIMVKSNHFTADSSFNLKPKSENEVKKKPPIDLNKPLRAGAFVDTEKLKELHNALSRQLPPEPNTWLLAEKDKLRVDKRKLQEERRLSSVVEKDESSLDVGGGATGACSATSEAIDVPRANRYGANDQKLLKMLSCPFADGSPITDLAQFYQDCMHAPQLSGSGAASADSGGESTNSGSSRSDDDAAALSQQLLMFESSIPEFDSVIASMYSSSIH